MFQTHTIAGVASNITPNQSPLIANGGSRIDASTNMLLMVVCSPAPGDVLFKGLKLVRMDLLHGFFLTTSV